MTVKILIADDHEIVRTGLKSLLTNTDIEVTAEAEKGEDAVRLALEGDLTSSFWTSAWKKETG